MTSVKGIFGRGAATNCFGLAALAVYTSNKPDGFRVLSLCGPKGLRQTPVRVDSYGEQQVGRYKLLNLPKSSLIASIAKFYFPGVADPESSRLGLPRVSDTPFLGEIMLARARRRKFSLGR